MSPSTSRKPAANPVAVGNCVLCSRSAAVTLDLARRTIDRGPDPEDPSFALTAVLPELRLCEPHFEATAGDSLVVGWCDDERCRVYGPVGEASPCGLLFSKLKR